VQSSLSTKESVLKSSAECRIRSYFYKVQKELRSLIPSDADQYDESNIKGFEELGKSIEDLLLKFRSRLLANK